MVAEMEMNNSHEKGNRITGCSWTLSYHISLTVTYAEDTILLSSSLHSDLSWCIPDVLISSTYKLFEVLQ